MGSEKKLILSVLSRLITAILMAIVAFQVDSSPPCLARETHLWENNQTSLLAIDQNAPNLISSDLETGINNAIPPGEYRRDDQVEINNDGLYTRTVRVGLYQNPPKVFIDEKGLPSGIFVDLLNEIAKKEKWNLVYIPCEWPDCLEALEEHRIDLMPDVAYSRERNKKYDFHQTPVVDSWSQVYANSSTRVETLSDLNGRRIAVLKEGIQEEIFQQMMNGFGFKVTFVEAKTYEEAFMLAAHGYADAVLSNHFIGDYIFQKYGLTRTPIIFNPSSLYFATAQGRNPELLDAIDRNLTVWRSQPDSYYYKTLARWMEKPPVQVVPRYFIWIIIVTGGFLFLSVGIIQLLRVQVRAKTRYMVRANKLLRRSEEKYRLLVENLNDVVFNLDAQGNITYMSPVAESIFGYRAEEIIGKSFAEYIHPDDLPGVMQSRMETLGGALRPYEFRMIDKNGSIHYVRTSSRPIERDGHHVGMTGMLTDITGERQAEEALRESEERHRTILHTIEDGYFEVDLKGSFTSFNESMRKMLGYDQEEMVGLNYRRYMAKKIAKKVSLTFNEVFRTGIPAKTADWRLIRKDGMAIDIETSISLKRNKSGEPTGFFGIARDISERRRMEEALKKERQDILLILDSSPVIIFYKDREGTFVRVNKTFAESLKMTQEEIMGKTVLDLYSREVAERMKVDDQEVIESGRPKLNIIEYYESAGGIRWVQTDKIPIYGGNNSVIGLVGFAQDITERKDAEEALKKERQDILLILDSSPTIIFYTDTEGKFIRVNKRFAMGLEKTEEEIVGKTVFDLFSRKVAEGMTRDDQEVIKSGFPKLDIIEQHESPIGPRWIQTDKIPVFDENNNVVALAGFAQDITDRKKAEEALRESEEKFRNLFRTSRDFLSISNLEGKVIDANDAAREFFGYSLEEIPGIRMGDLYEDPEDRQKLITEVLRNGYMLNQEIRMRKKDGGIIDALVTVSLLRDGHGNPIGFFGSAKDITEKKKMELQLLQTEKLSAVGTMISGVAHELNNPLTAIIGNAQLLAKRDVPEDIKNKLNVILKESIRSSKIVGGLLAFAREHKPERKMININDILMESHQAQGI